MSMSVPQQKIDLFETDQRVAFLRGQDGALGALTKLPLRDIDAPEHRVPARQ